jgi:hypothetical protein
MASRAQLLFGGAFGKHLGIRGVWRCAMDRETEMEMEWKGDYFEQKFVIERALGDVLLSEMLHHI